MSALKDEQIASVKALIAQAPDSAIRDLEKALTADQSAGATAAIRDLVNAEAVERRACAAVFGPLLQLCGPAHHDLGVVRFPEETPRRLWKALKQASRSDVEHAVAAWLGRAWSDSSPPVFDKLCARAAKALRAEAPEFAAVLKSLSERPGEDAAHLALVLEISPLARAAVEKLPTWVARTSGANVAAMRLIYKDAVSCGEGAGPLLLEILLAHMAEPWMIMKIVAGIMDTPNERYVAASELASLPERLMDSIDEHIEAVRRLEHGRGREGGAAAATAVSRGLATLTTLEATLSLQKDAPWSNRLAHQRRALAGAVEARLKEVEAALNAALPVQSSRIAGRALQGMPRLTEPPAERLVERAEALLGFVVESRPAGDIGGFGTLRGRVQDTARARMDQYGEDLLEMMRDCSPADHEMCRKFLEATAGLVAVLQGTKAAGILRKRAAAA